MTDKALSIWPNQPKRDKWGKVVTLDDATTDPDEGEVVVSRFEEFIEQQKQVPRKRGRKQVERERKQLKRHQADQYVEWLLASVEPEKIPDLLQEALDFARAHKSYKGVLEVLKFIMEYSVGSPLKRAEVAFGAQAADWADAFADPDPVAVFGANEIDEEEEAWLLEMLQKRRDSKESMNYLKEKWGGKADPNRREHV